MVVRRPAPTSAANAGTANTTTRTKNRKDLRAVKRMGLVRNRRIKRALAEALAASIAKDPMMYQTGKPPGSCSASRIGKAVRRNIHQLRGRTFNNVQRRTESGNQIGDGPDWLNDMPKR